MGYHPARFSGHSHFGSEVINLVCHVIKVTCDFMGDRRHCGSGDIKPLFAKEENSRCSRVNPSLLFNF